MYRYAPGSYTPQAVVATLFLVMAITVYPAADASAECTCRLDPLANFGSFFVYLAELRDTCEIPPGETNCSSEVELFLVADTPGLPQQRCDYGECEEDFIASANRTNKTWSIPRAYPSNYSLHSISNSNPAYFAVFPSGKRPEATVVRDFTLANGRSGEEVYVRTFQALNGSCLSCGGGESTRMYAVGAEFEDDDPSDNIIISAGNHLPGAKNQPFCRVFQYSQPGEEVATSYIVLVADTSAASEGTDLLLSTHSVVLDQGARTASAAETEARK